MSKAENFCQTLTKITLCSRLFVLENPFDDLYVLAVVWIERVLIYNGIFNLTFLIWLLRFVPYIIIRNASILYFASIEDI